MAFGRYSLTLLALAAIAVRPDLFMVMVVNALTAVALMYVLPLLFRGRTARRVYAALDAAFAFVSLPIVCVLCLFVAFGGKQRRYGYSFGFWRGYMAFHMPVLLIKYVAQRVREARTGEFQTESA